MIPYAVFGFGLAGSLTAFLIFNYHPAKIFMGDTGSMLIGLVNAILVVKFISVAQTQGISVPVYAAPAVGFTVLLIPLLDTLRVFGIRIFHQRSPFIPDRNHIHHLMLDKGWSHNTITFTLAGFSLAFVAASYLFRLAGCTWIVLAGTALFFAGIATLYYTRKHPRLFVARMEAGKLEHQGTRIVPLTKDIVLEQQNLKG